MKNLKIIGIFIIVLIIIIVGGYFGIKYAKNKNEDMKSQEIGEEYTPQEEINDEQNRQTIVSLYFIDAQTNEIIPEARLIDVSTLINEPYDKMVNLLLEGPKNEKLKSVIPAQTKLLGTSFTGDCVTVNLSNEFLNYENDDMKNKAINTIVNTLTELTEVNTIKFLINGEECKDLKDSYVRI